MVGVKSALLATVPLALAQQNTTNSTTPNNGGLAYSPPEYPSPWGEGLGDWSSAYEKAHAFVSKLTLIEKVNLTTGVGWSNEKCVGNVGELPRLGFKSLCMQDSPLGVRFADFVSAFPAGITVASTWDRKTLYQRGHDMGSEHKNKGVDVQLGPVVGPIGRIPEGGRNWEGFSPDPALSGIAVAETIKGIQDAGVMACTKHYIGNEQEHFRQPGNGLEALSSNIDDTTMHELYLWPFADAVKAGTASIMCSYNQINNSYGCQNSYLNNYLLKNELGFQGFIMSDWSAQHAGVASTLAGLDMTMPGDVGFDSSTSFWGANLTISVLNGSVPEYRLDDMATRIMAGWYYVDRENNQVEDAPNFSSWTQDTEGFKHFYGMEDYTVINKHVNVQADHAKNIRDTAAKGTVLLKNKGALPLSGTEKLTALFGSDAAENKYGANGCGDHGCDMGTLAMGWGSGTSNFPYLITPLEAIKAEVRKNKGDIEAVTDDWATSQATALARRVGNVGGACLVFGNSDAGEGYITVDTNAGDRNNLTLWNNADNMIKTVAGQCNNTIVIMHTVGPVLTSAWKDHPNVTAIVWAAIPGQESGNSLVDVLYGDVNPGGKTPFTWGNTRESYGTDILYKPNNGAGAPQQDFTEGVFIDYRYFDKTGETPDFEFGFGLSYTTFSYSNLQIQAHSAPAYVPTTGETESAPTFGNIDKDASKYVFPLGFHRVKAYIYAYLNSTDLKSSSGDPYYNDGYKFPAGSSDSKAQPLLRAGSKKAPGGNQGLYDVLFTVTATVSNTGKVAGDEVPQLYVSLGGPKDPKVVLRNFDRLTIPAGSSATFKADITRRDISNWDTNMQDWFISEYPKTVYVGSSSRKLPLKGPLKVSGSTGPTSIPSYPHSTSSMGEHSTSSTKGGHSASTTVGGHSTTKGGHSTSVSTTAGGHPTTTKGGYHHTTTHHWGPPHYTPTSYGPPHHTENQWGPPKYHNTWSYNS